MHSLKLAQPASGWAFASAASDYWFEVFPHVYRELRRWRRLADAIPDPVLRRDALESLADQAPQRRGRCRVRHARSASPASAGGAAAGGAPVDVRLPRHAVRAAGRRPARQRAPAPSRAGGRADAGRRARRLLRLAFARRRRRLPARLRGALPGAGREPARLRRGSAAGACGGGARGGGTEPQPRRAPWDARRARALGAAAGAGQRRAVLVGGRVSCGLDADDPRAARRGGRPDDDDGPGDAPLGRLLPVDHRPRNAARQRGRPTRRPRHRQPQPDRLLPLGGRGRRASWACSPNARSRSPRARVGATAIR